MKKPNKNVWQRISAFVKKMKPKVKAFLQNLRKGTKKVKSMAKKVPHGVALYFGFLLLVIVISFLALRHVYNTLRQSFDTIPTLRSTSSPISSGLLTTIVVILIICALIVIFRKRIVRYGGAIRTRFASNNRKIVWAIVIIVVIIGIIFIPGIFKDKKITFRIPNTVTVTNTPTNNTNHGTRTEDLGDLHWDKNILEPGIKYFFNRAVRFYIQLQPFDTLHFKKKDYENTVYWDMVYDTTEKRVRKINDHDDLTGWGRFYIVADKQVTTDVY